MQRHTAAVGIAAALVLAFAPLAAAARNPDLSWQARTRTVLLGMFGGQGPNTAGFNFDGHGNGHMIVTVPLHWRVSILFMSLSARRRSLMIVRGTNNLNGPFRPAFPHAATPDPTRGSAQGVLQRVDFRASRPGNYLIVCAIPGYADLGMWDRLVISARARVPSIRIARPHRAVIQGDAPRQP